MEGEDELNDKGAIFNIHRASKNKYIFWHANHNPVNLLTHIDRAEYRGELPYSSLQRCQLVIFSAHLYIPAQDRKL